MYVALCPELDVASQGATVGEATANLKEAVELFLECADPDEIKRRLHTDVSETGFEAAHGEASGPLWEGGLPDTRTALVRGSTQAGRRECEQLRRCRQWQCPTHPQRHEKED